MKISYYDILSHIIPASFLVFFLNQFYTGIYSDVIMFKNIDIIGSIGIIFVVGFLISSVSNFLEMLLDKCTITRKLNPELYMFIRNIAHFFNFHESSKLEYLLINIRYKNYLHLDEKNYPYLYGMLKRSAYNISSTNRLNEFKAQSSFARNISLVFLICVTLSFNVYLIPMTSWELKIFLFISLAFSLYKYFWLRSAYVSEIFNVNINEYEKNKS